ncbi:MAG: hypothetical protein A2096_16485 [Spirochaetes bacterium GWF1_41_5]|nr:MAG: hypothetical protein A2096_16485 [Spirochaetes bacterium GWF1_41_5]HBE04500.1 hypothetical protein [Spirochaetia bacterium]
MLKAENKISGFDCRVKYANYFQVGPGRCSWGPRINTEQEIIYQVQGESIYRDENNRELLIAKDNVLFIKAGEKHVFSCRLAGRCIISCLGFEMPGAVFVSSVQNGLADCEILPLFIKAAAEFKNNSGESEQLVELYIKEVIIRLLRAHSEGKKPLLVRRIIEYIEKNSCRKITRREIAGILGITPQYVNEIFLAHTGTSPHRYQQRLQFASARRMLLETDLDIKKIAEKSGFPDPFYFSRFFRRMSGVSPSGYRKNIL